VAGLWLLFGAISGIQIQISMLSHHHSWGLVIGYQVLVWSLWIPVTLAILRLVGAVPPRTPGGLLLHGAAGLAFAFAHVAVWVAIELVLKPYDFMNPTAFLPRFRSMALVQVPLELLLYGFVVLAHYADEASTLARRAAELEASLAQARLHALELQTQPHFLFNTLNGIGALVRGGQSAEAMKTISGLSDLLRYALERSGGGFVPLGEEVAMVERYLEIQRLRFSDRLTFGVEVEREAARGAVPALLLQPLAENAVRHGLAKSDASVRVSVRAARDGDALRIEIFNDGKLDPARRSGIGLSNTSARLAELYGDRARLELVEHDGGVAARVSLPWSEGR